MTSSLCDIKVSNILLKKILTIFAKIIANDALNNCAQKFFFNSNAELLLKYHISSVIRWSFFFQNTPKSLDLSHKTDLELCDCLRRVTPVI